MTGESPALEATAAVSRRAARASDARKRAIVVVPGIMGSELRTSNAANNCFGHFEGQVWPPHDFTPLPNLSHLFLHTDGIAPLHSCEKIEPSGRTNVTFFATPYREIVKQARKAGYTVVAYPGYDWRLDLRGQAKMLEQWIDTYLAKPRNANTDLYLVCHSMGGLVARAYVADPARAAKVKQVVTVGTPYLGAALASHRLITGTSGFQFIGAIFQPDMVRRLLNHSPGAMQLLPTERYFANLTKGYLKGARASDNTESYDDTLAYLVANGHTLQQILRPATDFHRDYGGFGSNFAARDKYTIMYSSNHSVAVQYQIKIRARDGKISADDTLMEWGDGTVAESSAALLGQGVDGPQQNGVAVFNFVKPGEFKEHGNMLNDAKIVADVLRVLEGRAPIWARPRAAGGAADIWPAGHRTVKTFGSGHALIEGPEGKVSGIDSEGKLRNELDEVTFEVFDEQATFAIPIEGDYRLEVLSSAAIPVQVIVDDYVAPATTLESAAEIAREGVADGELPRQQAQSVRRTIEFPEGAATAPISLNISGGGVAHPAEGIESMEAISRDGGPERAAALTGGALLAERTDSERPKAVLLLEGEQNESGKFVEDVVAMIRPIDAGADKPGVMLSYLSRDDGATWQAVVPPNQVLVPWGSTTRLLFYSVDSVGDQEYPPQEYTLAFGERE